MIAYFLGYTCAILKLYGEVENVGCRKFIVQKLKEMEKKMRENNEILEFYRGYIYALIEVYAEIKDLPESEVVFDLLKSALKDFEVEVRKAAREEEAPEGLDLGKRMDG